MSTFGFAVLAASLAIFAGFLAFSVFADDGPVLAASESAKDGPPQEEWDGPLEGWDDRDSLSWDGPLWD